MNRSLSVMKTNIGAEVQDTSSAFATIITRFINRRYAQILRAINWDKTVDYSFTTVSGTQNYVLPDDFGKEISCVDKTNGTILYKKDLSELYIQAQEEIDDAGSVIRYAIYNDCVQAQPTSASVLAIVSSSASDTTQTVFVRGIASGVETYESVTLTGATPANTTNSYTRIIGISKSAATVGKVTITSNSAAVTQAVIPPETLVVSYKLIKLFYVPTQAISISLPYTVSPMPLSQDYDYPVIECSDALEFGALADAWRYKRQFNKATAMEVLFNQGVQELIFDKENQPNQLHQFSPTVYNQNNLY